MGPHRLARIAATIIATSALVLPGPAAAGPTVEDLLERIESLERSLEDVREQQKRPCECPAAERGVESAPVAASEDAPATGRAPADDAPAPATGRAPAAEAQPHARPSVVVDVKPSKPLAGYNDGFFLSSGDGDYKLRMRGYVQADSRFFVDHGGANDEFTVRRARLDFRGTLFDRYKFEIMPDFTEDGVSIEDALIDVEIAPWLELRAGKFKTPFGIERLQSSKDLPFAERSIVDNLVPNRDVGVRLSGKLDEGAWQYQLAVLNGVPDGADGNEDVNDSVDVVARVVASPFVNKQYSPLRGASVGLAGTYGKEQGDEDDDQLSDYRTTGRQEFFEWENSGDGAVADGGHWRVSPQGTWYEGPFGLLTEYVRSSQEVSYDGTRAWIDNDAWQVRTNVMLTGENASMEGIEPERPFDFGQGQWGAWELAMRWASLDVDPQAFDRGFADRDESARHADALAAAVNWYLNAHVTFYFHYEHTMFGGGGEDGDGDRDDEDVFLTRLQLKF